MKKKKLYNHLRFIYKVGLFKSLLILFAWLSADAEYKVKWRHHDVHLRKGTTDYTVYRQVLVFEHYASQKTKNVRTIIDLGANIGLATLYYKHKYPGATIIAVEPESGNFNMLKKNVAGLKNVYCVQKAIWNKSRSLQLVSTQFGEYGYAVGEEANEESSEIGAITIGDLCDQFSISTIDLLKIDIEGSEKELFDKGSEEWLPRVKSIVIELHDWFKPGCSHAFFKAISERPFNMTGRGENITITFAD